MPCAMFATRFVMAIGLPLSVAVASDAIILEEPRSSYNCETEVPVQGQPWKVDRLVSADGAFSSQMVDSNASDQADIDYYYTHVPGGGRMVGAEIHFRFEGIKRFKKGSTLELRADGVAPLLIKRDMEEGWINWFDKIYPKQLLAHFASAETVTFAYFVPNSTGKRGKPISTGTIDLNRMRAEVIALDQADEKLDAMQADYENQCQ